ESDRNTRVQKKIVQNTENKNAKQRINRTKTSNRNPVDFEDDSWSIEDNLDSSQNNGDTTFDGSESNDLAGDNTTVSDVNNSRQNQLEIKTSDYLYNLNARDNLLKSSSDDDDDDHDDEGIVDSNAKVVTDENRKNGASNSITKLDDDHDNNNENASSDHDLSSNKSNDLHENVPLSMNLKQNIAPSDPVICLTRLAKSIVNENVNSCENRPNKTTLLLDNSDEGSESESSPNSKDSANLLSSTNRTKRIRHLLSSSESDENNIDNTVDAVDNAGNVNDNDDDDNADDCESEQSASSSSKSAIQQIGSRKVKQNRATPSRIRKSQRLSSVKPTFHLSDNDDDGSDHEKVNEKDMKKKAQCTDSSADEMNSIKPRHKSHNTKRRRRLRKAKSDDSDDNAEEEYFQDNKGKETINEEIIDDSLDAKGRKKIRRIYTANRLSETTKAAEACEQERRRRLAERQKMVRVILT
ncbi:unnamed protein product, partial [Schistosoma mattheei]